MAELKLGLVGQIARSVKDIRAAEAWYRDVLGLRHLYTYGSLAFFDCDGIRLFLAEAEAADAALQQSVIYFRVDDIKAAFEALSGRGVAFQGPPHMIFRHEIGLEEWMAFFDDPGGGLLALMAPVQS